ncbi:UDP-N-acetylmuramoylalanyl-D-glutamate--2,6-diaminopimelate ligase [Streptococcus sp. HMSC074B11]|uniref:YiiX/YebB-like N1pC/P60 family cysteine hydrolase n=1 Tax=unclassified Streptococcus TaxID=2608887 RepID=UPI0008A59B84|nr:MULTISPECIES: YiiX/YebB-like N1pC/P60 family cysteine hydrolase [unclassified Streptococcus]OFK89007.1 UDP-N-acetylmuramoylalanyl-D-glutamate--2,6-diaminopimelate ligase [Streptococcus sp. HMSC056C01]OFN98729.1 UDP-N-acetylmuramoylalanyl-D-glutamate--2,6-diaminopimelate ligase [Streptococcus sp. HMSC074B11]
MLENGDLIFVKDDSDIGQAIQESTGHYSHVAIFLDGQVYHATVEGGVIAQLSEDFFEDGKVYDLYSYPKIDRKGVKKLAESLLGAPYNASFYPNGAGFYCSQFVAEILPIFETIPMKFGDGTKEIGDFWREYYRDLGLPVPLNQSGTNPSQLAASPLLVCKERNLHDSDF